VFERCGDDSCAGSNLPPILKFDPSGKLVKSFGEGMFIFPHGLHVDTDGNVWVADGRGAEVMAGGVRRQPHLPVPRASDREKVELSAAVAKTLQRNPQLIEQREVQVGD
jgi:hypothetical protein